MSQIEALEHKVEALRSDNIGFKQEGKKLRHFEIFRKTEEGRLLANWAAHASEISFWRVYFSLVQEPCQPRHFP